MAAKKPKLGSGARFKALVKGIKAYSKKKGRKKIEDPATLAASIGRKKYGATKFAKLATAGRKRSAKKRK